MTTSPTTLYNCPSGTSRLDWMGVILEIEGQFAGKVILPECSVIDEAVKLAGGHHSELRVKHVVKAVALMAAYAPRKALLDEDW